MGRRMRGTLLGLVPVTLMVASLACMAEGSLSHASARAAVTSSTGPPMSNSVSAFDKSSLIVVYPIAVNIWGEFWSNVRFRKRLISRWLMSSCLTMYQVPGLRYPRYFVVCQHVALCHARNSELL